MHEQTTSAAAVACAAAAWLAIGCAFNPAPVPVMAGPADLEALAGQWSGEYDSPQTGRSGSIVFKLVPGEEHAHGDVLMVPRGASHPYVAFGGSLREVERPELPRLLAIRFVAAEGGQVSGALEPYLDPDCDCEAVTRFVGRLHGDTIEGTFVTRTAGRREPATGRWKVTRARSRPGRAEAPRP